MTGEIVAMARLGHEVERDVWGSRVVARFVVRVRRNIQRIAESQEHGHVHLGRVLLDHARRGDLGGRSQWNPALQGGVRLDDTRRNLSGIEELGEVGARSDGVTIGRFRSGQLTRQLDGLLNPLLEVRCIGLVVVHIGI